jgi:hypothetical protein
MPPPLPIMPPPPPIMHARQHEAAADILEKQGDSEGAEISRRAMNDERRAARRDQFDADKDQWLSQW